MLAHALAHYTVNLLSTNMKELKIEKMVSWSQVPMTATVPTCIYGNRRPCTLEAFEFEMMENFRGTTQT